MATPRKAVFCILSFCFPAKRRKVLKPEKIGADSLHKCLHCGRVISIFHLISIFIMDSAYILTSQIIKQEIIFHI